MDEAVKITHPRLRPVEAFTVRVEGQDLLCLRDTQGFAEHPIFLNHYLTLVVSMMDGSNSLRDIQAGFFRKTGELLFTEDLEKLVQQLEDFRYLDGPSFQKFHARLAQEFRDSPIRPARHAGAAYEGSPEALRKQIAGFFARADGSGPVSGSSGQGPLRGLVAPHIDFHRGGPTYGHAYRTVAEHSNADRFIIFGTCHNLMQQRFALTEKGYDTPLGCAESDREFIRSLAGRLPRDYFVDEFSHHGEHSIEFQAVCLKYVGADKTDFKIIPILVGSFQDIYEQGKTPVEDAEIEAMVDGVKQTMREMPGNYCVIAGADLAHVGRRFGDPSGPTEDFLKMVEKQDREFLDLVATGDAGAVFDSIAADHDRRRVCGYPPIYMTLRCMEAPRGRLLEYRQWADLEAGAAVTYASLAFFD